MRGEDKCAIGTEGVSSIFLKIFSRNERFNKKVKRYGF